MRLLVCGSRTFPRPSFIIQGVLDGLLGDIVGDRVLIEGGAPGADAEAAEWAERSGVEHLQFKADWDSFGRAAGPYRNRTMLEEGKPSLVLAFVDRPLVKSGGSHDMVMQAKRAGLPVIVIEWMP